MYMFDRPLENLESRTLPDVSIGKLSNLLRNFANMDMNSWEVVIALIVVLAYVYPSMQFLPLIVLTTALVHQRAVAKPAERTAARCKISSGNHGPCRHPRSESPVTTTAEVDKNKNTNPSEIIPNFLLRLSVMHCALRGRLGEALTNWDPVILAGASQYLFVYALWRLGPPSMGVDLVAKYLKFDNPIRRWIPLPKSAVRPFFVPSLFNAMTDVLAVPYICANPTTIAHGVLRELWDRLWWAVLFRNQFCCCRGKVCNSFLCTNGSALTHFSAFPYRSSLQFFAIQWYVHGKCSVICALIG